MADPKAEELSEKPMKGTPADETAASPTAGGAGSIDGPPSTNTAGGTTAPHLSPAQYGVTRKATVEDEIPPPKPPRPVSPGQQAEATLKEAFPNLEPAVIKAVLRASGGRLEPAFNALLGMSDPSAQEEEPIPPPQPPRPNVPLHKPDVNTTTPQNQLEADELYARQLAEHYGGAAAYRPERPRDHRDNAPRRRETGLKPNELHDEDHSFFDDDLPVIKENIRKTFLETQSKVNKWVSDIKRRIDGDDLDDLNAPSNQGSRPGTHPQGYGGRRSGDLGRRSGERERYDADPQVLGDDFAGLELRDDDAPPPRTSRPLANPNLFKPTPSTPGTESRKVSFQAGPPTEIGGAGTAAQPERRPSPAGKHSKWEPLKAVEPSPMTDNDPFSLGDSDDEREAKSKDVRSEDTERLQKAAAEAMAEDIGKPGAKSGLEPTATSGPQGTRDREAEEILTGKS